MDDFESASIDSLLISESEKFESFASSSTTSLDTAELARKPISNWIEKTKNYVKYGKCHDIYSESTKKKSQNSSNHNKTSTSSLQGQDLKPYQIRNGEITPCNNTYANNFATACVFDTFDATNIFNDTNDNSRTENGIKRTSRIKSCENNTNEAFMSSDSSTIIECVASAEKRAPLHSLSNSYGVNPEERKPKNSAIQFNATLPIQCSVQKMAVINRSLNAPRNDISFDWNGNEIINPEESYNSDCETLIYGKKKETRNDARHIETAQEELSSTSINSDPSQSDGLVTDEEFMGRSFFSLNKSSLGHKEQSRLSDTDEDTSSIEDEENVNLSCIKTLRYQYKPMSSNMERSLSCIPQLNLKDYLLTLPTETKIVDTKIEFTIEDLEKPIGITLLTNGNIVVGERRDKNTVNVYDAKDIKMATFLHSSRRFYHPSDMTTLPDGRLVVRDNNCLHLFGEDGQFIKLIKPKGTFGRFYGVASDGRGNIITINTNPEGIDKCITKKDETDILVIDFENDIVIEKIELVDIIVDKDKSACRFLQCNGRKIYVVDLGLNLVYVLSVGTPNVKSFGKTGKLSSQWQDPAGIAVDSFGNMIIADACNNRIQVYDKHRNYLGLIKISTPLNRPSGIYLDIETKSLYVLNLRGKTSLIKLSLVNHSENI